MPAVRKARGRLGDHNRDPASPTVPDHRPAPDPSILHTSGCSFIRKETVTSHANMCVNHEEPADTWPWPCIPRGPGTARLQEGRCPEEAPALWLQRPREQASAGRHRRLEQGWRAFAGGDSLLAPHPASPSVSVSDPLGLRGQALRLLGVPGAEALARWRSYLTDTRRKSRRVAAWTAASRKK